MISCNNLDEAPENIAERKKSNPKMLSTVWFCYVTVMKWQKYTSEEQVSGCWRLRRRWDGNEVGMGIKGILMVMESSLSSQYQCQCTSCGTILYYGFANVIIEENWIKGAGISTACESTMISTWKV